MERKLPLVITFWKGVFVAQSEPQDRIILERAGFGLHEPTMCEDPARCKACRANIKRRYWSARVEDATRLKSFCNETALRVMSDHLKMLERSRAVDSNIVIPAPPGLEYIPYQKAGVAYALQRKDTLIGDEAGLGKTIQALGFVNLIKPKTVLVVAPATLAFNWKIEAERWLVDPYKIFIPKTGNEEIPKDDKIFVITNYEKLTMRKPPAVYTPGQHVHVSLKLLADPVVEPFTNRGFDLSDLVIVEILAKGMVSVRSRGGPPFVVPKRFLRSSDESNDQVERETPFSESLKRVWDVAVFDEAHAIKNPQSKRSQAVLGEVGLVRRSHRTLFLTGTPIENFPKEIWPVAATICPAKFGDWWAFARRYCGLHQEEHNGRKVWVTTGSSHLSELQQRLRASFMVRRLKHDVLKELPPKRRQLVVLGDEEVNWNQHPQFRRWRELYEQQYEAAMARLEAAKTAEEYKEAAKALEAFVGIAFQEMSEFRHKTALVKLPMCLDYIDNLLASGLDSVVIFAHHKDVLEKLAEHYGDQCAVLFGDTPMHKRGEVVKSFQDGPKKIFIGGLKAAGTGITLTKASTVIFVEIDWVPATLSQAEDRLCRIGQKKMVHVIHLVLNNTLDVNMSQRVIKKQETIDKALDHLPEHVRMKQTEIPFARQSQP